MCSTFLTSSKYIFLWWIMSTVTYPTWLSKEVFSDLSGGNVPHLYVVDQLFLHKRCQHKSNITSTRLFHSLIDYSLHIHTGENISRLIFCCLHSPTFEPKLILIQTQSLPLPHSRQRRHSGPWQLASMLSLCTPLAQNDPLVSLVHRLI